jgi:hypothetical protein
MSERPRITEEQRRITRFMPFSGLREESLIDFAAQTGGILRSDTGRSIVAYSNGAVIRMGLLPEVLIPNGENGSRIVSLADSHVILRGKDFAFVQPQLDPSDPVRVVSKYGDEIRVDDLSLDDVHKDPAHRNIRTALERANAERAANLADRRPLDF